MQDWNDDEELVIDFNVGWPDSGNVLAAMEASRREFFEAQRSEGALLDAEARQRLTDDCVVQRMEARRIAEDRLAQRYGSDPYIHRVYAFEEIDFRPPVLCLFMVKWRLEECWIAYARHYRRLTMICPSHIIVVCPRTGAVLYDGDASDEG